ncbi:MAG: STAS domain-containing protein [Gemmatimonadales bacterium]|nr:STAS domain-containing protein [Gemmatimonadales bacterium]
MTFESSRDPSGVTILTVEGQLIVANRQELKQLVGDALDQGDRKFVLDFDKTAYIDSSGLGALVSINKKVREAGGELRLSGLNEDLSSLFELTKLDTLFVIADSATEALAGF